MAFTQADIDALDRAIAKGVRRVHFADRSVEYASMAELKQAREMMQTELLKAKRAGPRFIQFYRSGGGL